MGKPHTNNKRVERLNGTLRERVRVDGVMLTPEEFATAMERVKEAGTLRTPQSSRDPQGPEGELATARLEVANSIGIGSSKIRGLVHNRTKPRVTTQGKPIGVLPERHDTHH